MPSRRELRLCRCGLCNGKLVNEHVWAVHQRAITQDHPLPTASSTSILPQAPDIPTGSPLTYLPPGDVLFDHPSPPKPDKLARVREEKRDGKRERSRYAQRAASKLTACIAEANSIANILVDVGSHKEIGLLQARVALIKTDLISVAHRAPNVDSLRNQLCRKLHILDDDIISKQSKLGERLDPIPCSIEPGILLFHGTLLEVSLTLVMMLALYFGLSRLGCDLTLAVLKIVLNATVSSIVGNIPLSADLAHEMADYIAQHVVKKLPLSMKTVFTNFDSILSDRATIYACCPKCCAIYPPTYDSTNASYPSDCNWKPSDNAPTCDRPLLQNNKPIRPFVLPDLFRYISKLLSSKEIEHHIDLACQEGLQATLEPPSFIATPFQATFLRTLKGPDGHRLFIDGGPEKEARLVFSLNVDWFNVFRTTNRGSSTSTGVICLSCLNLPPRLRNKFENMFVAIIPGPKSPAEDQINHFLRPLVDSIRKSFYAGLHLPSTPSFPNGRVVRSIVGPVVCDLPAARKAAGLASFNTKSKFCSHCNHSGMAYGSSDHPALETRSLLCGICSLEIPTPNSSKTTCEASDESGVPLDNDDASQAVAAILLLDNPEEMYNKLTPPIEHSDWSQRSLRFLRMQALAYKDIGSLGKRAKLWGKFGVRYSELHRLPPSWDPVQQLVIDPMHSNLEGVIQYHFRHLLRLSEEYTLKRKAPEPDRSTKVNLGGDILNDPVFSSTLADIDPKAQVEKAQKQISLINKHLSAPVFDNSESRAKLKKALGGYNKASLYLVAKNASVIADLDIYRKLKKKSLMELLVNWRFRVQPLRPEKFIPDNIAVLGALRAIIESTDVPSWITPIPRDWGSAAMGTPKADEWRVMATIYFPIALIQCWHGDGDESDNEGKSRRRLLELTMCLVQATCLAFRRRTSDDRRMAYLQCMCTYLHNLESVIDDAHFRPNHHFSIHLYEFMDLWGPVYYWWCFPFERINGLLQRIGGNNKFGELEITMSKFFSRRANFKHWLSISSEHSRHMCALKGALDGVLQAIGWGDHDDGEDVGMGDGFDFGELATRYEGGREYAHFRYGGVVFSRERSHTGNSRVAYKSRSGLKSYGSIQRIQILKSGEGIVDIKPYHALSMNSPDAFSRYAPHFPVKLLAVETGGVEQVSISAITCHCASYRVSPSSVVMVEISRVSSWH